MPDPNMTQVNTSLPDDVLAKLQDFCDQHGTSRAAAMRQILAWYTRNANSGVFVHIVPGDDLQAAIDSCPPGGTLVMAPGNYIVDKTLIIPFAIHVKGTP